MFVYSANLFFLLFAISTLIAREACVSITGNECLEEVEVEHTSRAKTQRKFFQLNKAVLANK